jgi:Ca2+-binding EF-hand superfamily protein
MLQWITKKNYSLSEAFKVIDNDFDGSIGLKDLQVFIT